MLTTITQGGRLVIPARLRKRLGLRVGSKVEISEKHDQLVIRQYAPLAHAQAIAAKVVRLGTTSAAEELIAERRREAERE